MTSLFSKIAVKFKLYIFKFRDWVNTFYGSSSLDYSPIDIKIKTDNLRELNSRANSVSKEPDTVKWIETFVVSDDILFDIGANIGAYSLIAGKRGARVYAFEPAFQNFFKLEQNILLNSLEKRISAFHLALSDNRHVGDFVFQDVSFGTSRCYYNQASNYKTESDTLFERPVLVFCLDDFITSFDIPIPNHIKIDVDGAEIEVLKGASRTLKRTELKTVLIEIDHKMYDLKMVKSLFLENGFKLHSKNCLDDRTMNCLFVRETKND